MLLARWPNYWHLHDRGDGGYELTYRRFQNLHGQHIRVLSHGDPIDPIDSKSTTVILY